MHVIIGKLENTYGQLNGTGMGWKDLEMEN